MLARLLALTSVVLLACVIVGARKPDAQLEEPREDVSAPLDQGELVERVQTREGVYVPVLVREPSAAPTAIALFFPGGGGQLALSANGIGKGADNFMVRTRARFAAAGFVTIVVDAPSDHREGLTTFRASAEQAEDVAKLRLWARERWDAPVWLIGTSRGTSSAADAPARGVPVDGLVLTSSVTAGDHGTLLDLPLEMISVPTLLVHHEHDACPVSPLKGAHELKKLLVGAASVELETFKGGDPPRASSCSPLSHHGFLGLDEQVVDAIVAFVGAHR